MLLLVLINAFEIDYNTVAGGITTNEKKISRNSFQTICDFCQLYFCALTFNLPRLAVCSMYLRSNRYCLCSPRGCRGIPPDTSTVWGRPRTAER